MIIQLTRRLLATVILGALATTASVRAEDIVYHPIRLDAEGQLLPWASPDPATAYDHGLRLIWRFWQGMPTCPNGVPYYLQHQVWANPHHDGRGLGGDQINMALSSWSLLYGYLGDRALVENMTLMADFWLDHGMSPATAAWPKLPFPYNTDPLHGQVGADFYNGDMRAGKGFLQPDKAATFAAELIGLHEMTGSQRYLQAAVAIADTLSDKIQPGDGEHSPWPFRVQAFTGAVNAPYTANWTGALRMYEGLIRLQAGKPAAYERSLALLSAWMKAYPLQTNKWGPFFEDIEIYSETETNADTMAWFLLEHPDWDPRYLDKAGAILRWSSFLFASPLWVNYGVSSINEQTAYTVPGNSHTSRHASVQLLYAEKSGDASRQAAAIRQLNWATYSVGEYGNNCYPLDNVWLTDGYGDYVRHYLRAMAACPRLSPVDQDHLLRTSSTVKQISYRPQAINYTTFAASRDLLRISFAPTRVTMGTGGLPRLSAVLDLEHREGYTYNAPGDAPGVLRIRHDQSGDVQILGGPLPVTEQARDQSLKIISGQDLAVDLSRGLEMAEGVQYVHANPFHGKLRGTAPKLVYQSEAGFYGHDLITFVVRHGTQESTALQVAITVEPDPQSTANLAPPDIEYVVQNQYVAAGDTATFGVRTRSTGLHCYQWQRSRDDGRSWQDLSDTNSIMLAVKATSQAEFDGNLFRCRVSRPNGASTLSKALKLTVAPAGTGPFIYSGWMMEPNRLSGGM